MSPTELCAEANTRLAMVYEPILSKWREMENVCPGMSRPMFLKAKPAYFAAKPRVIFVGQETHGWWSDCPHSHTDLKVDGLMSFYQGDVMNRVRLYYRSPFWHVIRKIVSAAGLEGYPDSILTANIFASDFKRGRADGKQLEVMRDWNVLPQELQILDPDVVIFFIGPVYSYSLRPYFNKPLEPNISAQSPCVAYQAPGAKWQGWVTYHPKYLQLSKHRKVAAGLASALRTMTGK